VIGHNGLVKHSRYFGLLKPRVGKGDKIIVNYKKVKKKRQKGDKANWNNIIENLTIKITGIATLWVLVGRIN